MTFGENTLSGKLGFIATLHTWDQQLKAYFHLHCLVAGGVVSKDGSRWIPCKKNYLFNHQAIALVFRAKFVEQMDKACQGEKIKFSGGQYKALRSKLYDKNWIVDVRDPVKNPEHVLEYLARYTHRVAIANSRITALEDGCVTFKIKNRKKNRKEQMTISAVEFIRRFYLHSLPGALSEYGITGSGQPKPVSTSEGHPPNDGIFRFTQNTHPFSEEMLRQLTGTDITQCPCCHKGKCDSSWKYRGLRRDRQLFARLRLRNRSRFFVVFQKPWVNCALTSVKYPHPPKNEMETMLP